MAMMDNTAFLISHIRNSFITSDDTGMCEVILEAEQFAENQSSSTEKRPTTWHGASEVSQDAPDGNKDLDVELAHSYDILADMVFDGHRRRSGTAQRLEKLKREKQKQSKIKHIQWKNVQYTVNEIGEYFDKKDMVNPDPPAKRSLLSQQLDEISPVPNNPFTNYIMFDGRSGGGAPTKKIEIFLTMASEIDRPFPMMVVTLATATVQDLIGLICWQYFTENRVPLLTTHLGALALHIAEDDGEVDMDFPALDNKEPISKFGFSKLALVQKDIPEAVVVSDIVLKIDLQDRGIYSMSMENEQIMMREILTQILTKHSLQQRPGLEYKLEKRSEPDVMIDLNLPLSAMATHDFYLIRENSARSDSKDQSSPTSMSEMDKSLSSMHYEVFNVNMVYKLKTNKEIQLGVSGDKVEIDPLTKKALFKTKTKTKPVTIDIEDIAACSRVERKHGKSTFRIVYNISHEFKHHDFECDTNVAEEIVTKINNIIDMRSSPVRKDYRAHKEKKLLKRTSMPL